MHAQWDTAFLVGMWIFVPVFIICVLVALGGLIAGITSKGDHGVGTCMVGVVGAVLSAIVVLIIWFPFSSQYNRYVPKSGTVATTGSRFLSDGNGGTDQKYVFTFTDGRSFGVLDTRAANVKPGDKVTLLCERSFQWNAPDEGWDCNWGEATQPDGTVIP